MSNSYWPSGALLSGLTGFFNDGVKIGDTAYKLETFGNSGIPGTFSWTHCGNTRFMHDCIVFTLSGYSSPVTYEILKNSNNFEIPNPPKAKWPYFNILPILDEDPHTQYFLNWMTINDLRFTGKRSNDDNINLNNETLKGTPSLSSWVTKSSYFNDATISSMYCAFGTDTDDKRLTSEFYDVEQFVKPFDTSTNLIYYKGGTSENLSGNDIFILNAKKMYTDIDYLDKKPKDTSISLDMSSLADKEITLTGIINVASDKAFTEIYPYVNDEFKYTYSDNINDETLQRANFRRIRYTDYRNKAQQWRLFKANSYIAFTTTDDFECRFMPKTSMTSSVTIGDDEKINIPCKMTIKFKDLIFQQKIREGIQFDDISSIDFENKIYNGDIFNGSMSENKSLSGYSLKYLSNNFDIDGVIYKEITVNDEAFPDGANNYSQGPIGYMLSLTSYMDIKSIGDSDYNFDLMSLNTINNSVNKWKTTYSNTKYSDLFIYSDYNPKGDNCIGTPYTNLDDKVMLEVEYPEGTIGGGDGVLRSATYIAERVKIATDKKYINNIRGYDELDVSQHRFDRNDVVTLTNPKCTGISEKSPNYNITFEISGVITDPKSYGYEFVELPLSAEKSGKKFKSIQESTNIKHDSILIFFDGLDYDKKVILNENELYYSIGGEKFKISQVLSSNIHLTNGEINGKFTLEFINADSLENEQIEIHNVKLPEPKIKSIKIDFNDRTKEYLTKDGLLKVDDDVWAKYIMLNKSELRYDLNESPAFLFQDSDKIRSNCVELYDKNNNLTGLLVTLKINGFRKFEKAGFNWKFTNPKEVVLSSQEMVDDYENISKTFSESITPTITSDNLIKIFPEYRNNAKIGEVVISGDNVGNEFNSIKTVPITGRMKSVGECLYKVNPPENDKFQLELLIKAAGKIDFEKYIYYVNKPVGRWYNLSLYKYQDKVMTTINNKSDYEDLVNYGLTLTDVTGDSIADITEKSDEIFNCFVVNDSMTKGDKIECNVDNVTLSSLIRNGMYKYDAMYDIKFDPCSRYPFNLNFTTDSSVLKYQGIEITETEYNKKDRRNKDLFSISKDITRILNKNNFTKHNVAINLFDNQDVKSNLSTSLINFEFNDEKPIDYNYNDLKGRYDSFVTDALIKYIPRRIFLDDSDEYYVLEEKSNEYHVSPIPGMKVKSVMWIVSPDFSDDSGPGYAENETDSILMLKDFKNMFDNPHYKLPPVHYSQKILNSDYSTLVYNSCKSLSAVQTDFAKLDLSDSKYVLDYSKNPTIIAYVWDNSQVSRNETKGKNESSRLQYSRLLSDYEYIAEVGSIYNYEDRQNTTNIVLVEASSPIERQTTLMPVMTTPFAFEKLSNESAYVKVVDDIIATAALGYSNVGYARNAVMKFVKESINRDIKIDTTQTTYLYLTQNEKSNNCSFGATQEKPVYVDTVSQNYASLAETYNLMPEIYPASLPVESFDPR